MHFYRSSREKYKKDNEYQSDRVGMGNSPRPIRAAC